MQNLKIKFLTIINKRSNQFIENTGSNMGQK